ncbi:SHOCT domain-containing protein [Belnapia sp. T18]|uniref:SHOCT domain-containing protein n=1 Tax=Belnapia arida TaxID=2804533 RepID=A0ABS1TYZ2_9PROT|nr:SHOCT domain-containing protein [Belnapia arida]MBL6077638.1 SHOCT domain-containing protein [Belnapia arida]
MRELTGAGERQVAAIAARHGVGREAALVLLHALAEGGGSMAQFSHPELGGMGQWSQGRMVMVGDMFNQALKARVDALCRDLAGLLRGGEPVFAEAAAPAAQGGWWPAELGSPAASGTQNGMGYALFPAARRLAVRQDGRVRVFDTGDHRIGGVSQQQGSGQVLAFSGDRGEVRLEALREVRGETPAPASDHSSRSAPAPSHGAAPAAEASPAASAGGDPVALIRRLAELHRQGMLTDAEFQAKKTELLGRV